MKKGFSLIEVILALAMFVIFATGAGTIIVRGFKLNQQGAELTVANQFASEGLEAVRSIKNQAFSNLTNSSGVGLRRNGSTGVWEWQTTPANNSLVHNTNDNYTRVIKVEDVRRDSSGNIVSSGGTIDPNTKKITSTVDWNINTANPETISLLTYLNNWRRPLTADGIVVYGDTASPASPKYRDYTNSTNTFNSEQTVSGGFTDTLVGKTFKLKTSPTKQEMIAGYVNNSGVLRILCFDGSAWTSEWTVSVGGTGTNDQRFGIAYETNSGDVLVVYSTNTSTTNEMAYRTKLGTTGCGATNWSSATSLTAAQTNGVVQWIRMEHSPVASSNNIALAWADNASDLSAMIWTGAGFTITEPDAALETELERVSASQDVQSFDIAFENTSGELMVVWGLNRATTCTAGTTIAATNCIRYRTYTTSWSAANAVIPTVADPATNVDITANPNTGSNEIILASLDNSQGDLSTAYWSGSAWTGRANVDTAAHCVRAGEKIVATGWLISGATTRSVIVYHDATSTTCTTGTTNIGWYVANGSGAPAAQGDFTPVPAFANPQRWYDIQMDPINKDRLIFTISDNGSDLFAKRLVMSATPAFTWTNADSSSALETSLGQATSGPFGFTYWRSHE